jgi:tetratricopeptide (TPR) repeat protein
MSQQNRQLYNQSRAAFEAGRLTEAHGFADRMIANDRKDYNGWIMRGRVRLATGRRGDALRDFQRAQKLQPGNPRVFIAIGRAHQALGDHASALAQYDRALNLDGANDQALAAKLRCLELQNKPDRALRIIERRLRDALPSTEIGAVYVRLLSRDGDHERAAEIGRRVAEADRTGGDPLRHLCFAIAAAFEKLKDYGQAMNWGHRANSIAAAPFDRNVLVRVVDELCSTFTAERLRALPRVTVDTSRAMFIVGMPRSGSTLIERILDAHPAGFGAGESPALHLIVQRLSERLGSTQPYPACISDLDIDSANTAASDYLAEIGRQARTARRIIDKHLANFMHLGVINCLLPEARVVHSVRDPINTCLSCFFERLSPRNIPYASTFEDLAFYFAQYRRVIEHFRTVVDLPLLDVSYEQLVADPETNTRAILDFADLPFDDRCLRFHETKRAAGTLSYEQVTRPVYQTSVSRADRFGALLDPLRDALRAEDVIDA